MSFCVQNIVKSYDATAILKQVSFSVEEGEFIALLGPSGSGKTTLLNIIAGLQQPDSGQLLSYGKNITEQGAGERQFGMVFQSYALFKHMSVAQNIAFGLKVLPRSKRPKADAIARRVSELLQMIEMSDFADRYPAQLSGGQSQRAAMARALAIDPKLLLLDEPFSALDAKVRRSLRNSVKTLQRELKIATILVTHDQSEAWALADKVAIMNNGLIEQFDTPDVLRNQPATEFVRDFLRSETQ
jgi:ABC-type Fe3+/spermidine/putrescine transport system ATPase subunit